MKSLTSVLALGLTLMISLTVPPLALADRDDDDDDRKERRTSWSWTDRDYWRGGGHKWKSDDWREAREERRDRRQARFERIRAHKNECAELIGGTRGLFGMCVRYCAAQSCIDEKGEDAPKACALGAPRYLERYNALKTASDPEMPCIKQPEESSCPCWAQDELDGLRQVGDQDVAACSLGSSTANTGVMHDWSVRPDVSNPSSFQTQVSTFSDLFSSGPLCRLTDTCTDGNCLGVNRTQNLTETQLAACQQMVAASAQARGLACN